MLADVDTGGNRGPDGLVWLKTKREMRDAPGSIDLSRQNRRSNPLPLLTFGPDRSTSHR
jgi:hypothetical protein